MRMTERVKEIVELNLTDHYIPLVLHGSQGIKVFPAYFGRIMEENQIAIPVTNATDILEVLKEEIPASALVADREGGFESYLLQGRAHRITSQDDYQFVAGMQNETPGFPIHGAVVFEVEAAHLVPPP